MVAMNTTGEQTSSPLDRVLTKLRARLPTRQYCDTGPHVREWRVDVGTLYLTDDELRAVADEAVSQSP